MTPAFSKSFCGTCPPRFRGSAHPFKYRLAFIVNGKCILRYDNERGKGDHRHMKVERKPSNLRLLKLCSMASCLTWKGYANDNIDRALEYHSRR